MAEVQKPKSATTIFLDQPPSCLEFCPEIPDHFVVGTYLLSETKNEDDEVQQTKTGSVQLWKLDLNTNNLRVETPELARSHLPRLLTVPNRSLVQKVSLPYAVFDLHFHPRDKSKFAIASSTGCISLFSISATEPSIHQIWTKQVHDDDSIPALFLAWAPKNWFSEANADGFAVTFSDSRTAVFGTTKDITNDSAIAERGSFEARQMIEVWFVALVAMQVPGNDESKMDTIPFMFTGNDFGSLHTRRFESHDAKEQDDDEALATLLLEHDDRARHHTAGVTSILPLPVSLVDDAPFLLTGSYDEGLRVYHATRRGEVLAEQGLGGGVWRLQLLDTKESDAERHFLVLASCMHAGTRVVRVTQTQQDQTAEWGIEVLAEFTEHESMNYASDVWKGPTSSELLCVSSSFYDRRVCVWRANV